MAKSPYAYCSQPGVERYILAVFMSVIMSRPLSAAPVYSLRLAAQLTCDMSRLEITSIMLLNHTSSLSSWRRAGKRRIHRATACRGPDLVPARELASAMPIRFPSSGDSSESGEAQSPPRFSEFSAALDSRLDRNG
jgi:hypothetical protein